MAMDDNGDNHQPAGRPDGGQYAPKAGRNTDDDLEPDPGAALGIAGHWLDGQRVAAREAADATVGDDAWYTNKGRELGCEYADAIVDAAIHADDIPAGTTITDMAFDDEALAEYQRTWTPTPAPTTSAPPPPTPPRAWPRPPNAPNASSRSWSVSPSPVCAGRTTTIPCTAPWASPPPSSTRGTC